MAASKRTSIQRDADLAFIAEAHLMRGLTQEQIAEELAKVRPEHLRVSREQVSYDLRSLQRRWQAESVALVDKAKSEELGRLDQLGRTYYEAWRRSCQAKKRTRRRASSPQGQGDDAGSRGGRVSLEEDTEARDGNPAFLQGVERVIAERRKLLGLDAPVKVEHDIRNHYLVWDEPGPRGNDAP